MKIVRRIGDRGQVTIPKEVREIMEIEEGDFVELEITKVHHRRNGPSESVIVADASQEVPE